MLLDKDTTILSEINDFFASSTTNCTFKVPTVETVGYGFLTDCILQHCPRFQPWDE